MEVPLDEKAGHGDGGRDAEQPEAVGQQGLLRRQVHCCHGEVTPVIVLVCTWKKSVTKRSLVLTLLAGLPGLRKAKKLNMSIAEHAVT